jgi:oxygen-dependent protoporphyrinogen oxidase
MKIAIVGGGVSGLATAAFLDFPSELGVFEASDAVGGLIRSQTTGGVVHDLGANGFLNDEPTMDLLLEYLGLQDQCVIAPNGARYLFHKGQAVALPAKPPGIFKSQILPVSARLRLLLEPFQPLKKHEQNVADYLNHRIGEGATTALADAMVSGIWAGDTQTLSMQAAFPRLVQAVETEGSLYKALKAKKAAGKPTPQLTSLVGGMGQLAETIAHKLQDQLHTACPISELSFHKHQWRLQTPNGAVLADQVVLAVPASACAQLLSEIAPLATQALLEIPTSPVAVVHHLFDAQGWTVPSGFGVLIPRKEELSTLGVLYSSSIFRQRCPEDKVLVRSILGGATAPALCDRPPESIQESAFKDLQTIWGTSPAPLKQSIVIHKEGIPQYTLGHLDRIRRIQAALSPFPSLHLAGNYLGGVAVKDCVRVAHKVALQVRKGLVSGQLN